MWLKIIRISVAFLLLPLLGGAECAFVATSGGESSARLYQ